MADGARGDYSTITFWDRLVQGGPAEALAIIGSLLEDEVLDADARALAHGAAGRSLFELGRIDEAASAARRGLVLSTTADPDVRTWIAMAASFLLAEAGQIDEALASLYELAADIDGVDLGRVRLQAAYVLQHAGRLNEALSEFDRSERLLLADGDRRDHARVYLNRGLVLLQQGRLRLAAADFDAAEAIAEQIDMTVLQAQTVANRAVLLGRSRRLAAALSEFDRAAELFEAAGNPHRPVAIMKIDRAEVLMHSGLLADAAEAGRSAIALVEPSKNAMLLGDALLMTARAELAAGHARAAMTSARHAEEVFVASDRVEMVSHARSIVVRASLAAARDIVAAEQPLADAVGVIESLRAAGWTDQADELAAARVRSARRWQRFDLVRSDVDLLRRGSVDGRRDTALAGWWAEAVGRLDDGDAAGAVEACHNGLDVLDGIVDEAPSLGERSAAMRMGSDLSQLLIEISVDLGAADTALAAAEGTRARALHEELVERERYRPLTRYGAERLRHELTGRLGERTLVEWILVRDRVWAVVFDQGGSRLVEVADRTDVVRARDRVRMWLDVATIEPDGSSERAARAAAEIDRLLMEPLKLADSAGVVIVPTDLLHDIPWSGMPTFAGRPFSLAPNAQVWLEADHRVGRLIRSVGLVVGPGVEGSARERDAVAAAHPGVAVAAGPGATASTVRSMLAGSDLVHVAAHGTFRSDHPLLSTLRLHDGEATLYDIVPERVDTLLAILSSCEGGAQGTADGSEVLGLSAVLLARGAASVLAPLTAVRELECADFVADVHRELAAGEPVACAVANVRERWLADDDLSRWAVASSFACFGTGNVAVAG